MAATIRPGGLLNFYRRAAWAGRRRILVGLRDVGGVRRHPFGVGEGPAEAVAEAKQESTDRYLSPTCEIGQVGQKWVSRHVLVTCQSQW